MVDVYRTEVTFAANDELTARLREITNSLRAADTATKSLQKTLDNLKIGRVGLPDISVFRQAGLAAGRSYAEGFAEAAGRGIREAMASSVTNAGAQAGAAAGAAFQRATGGGSGGGGVLAIGGGGGGSSNLRLNGGGGSSGGGSGGMVPYGAGGGGAGGSGMQGMFAAGARAFSAGQGGGGGGRGGGGGGGGNNGGGFGQIYAGHMFLRGGEDILHGIAGSAEHGMEYASAVARLRAQGLNDEEMKDAVSTAWATTRSVPTTTATGNIEETGKLRYILGSTSHATEALAPAMRMSGVLREFSGGKLGATQVEEAIRALEQENRANTTEQLVSNMGGMTGAIAASGGTVTPQALLGFAKRAGMQNTAGIGDDFLYQYAPRLVQMMGGQMAGTGYAAVMRELITGVAGGRTVEGLGALNLLNEGHVAGKGIHKHLTPGAIVDEDLASSNLYEWVQKYVAPQMVGKSAKDIQSLIGHAFGTGPNQRVMAEMVLGGRTYAGADAPFERDARLVRSVKGEGTYNDLLKSSPELQLFAFNQQWKNFSTALGTTVLPIIVPALHEMTNGLIAMTTWAREHPEAVQTIIRMGAALGAAMVAIGAFAVAIGVLAVLFTMGGVLGGIGLFGGALAGLAVWMATGSRNSMGLINALQQLARGFGMSEHNINALSAAIVYFGNTARNTISQLTFGGIPGVTETHRDGRRDSSGSDSGGAGVRPYENHNTRPWSELPGVQLPRALREQRAREGAAEHSAYHPAHSVAPVIVQATLLLDGRVAARTTMRHMVAELGHTSDGGNTFDGRVLPYLPTQAV